jgi:S1-C subfamily serine protease
VLVESVVEDSPIDTAGVLPGDIIVALDEKTVRSVDDLHRVLDEHSVDRAMPVVLLRDNGLVRRQVTPREG